MKIDWNIINGFFVSFKRPLALVIESTNDCKANCIMCSRDNLIRDKSIMNFELFKKIILGANKMKISFFQLSFYGESLLDPLIYDKIR